MPRIDPMGEQHRVGCIAIIGSEEVAQLSAGQRPADELLDGGVVPIGEEHRCPVGPQRKLHAQSVAELALLPDDRRYVAQLPAEQLAADLVVEIQNRPRALLAQPPPEAQRTLAGPKLDDVVDVGVLAQQVRESLLHRHDDSRARPCGTQRLQCRRGQHHIADAAEAQDEHAVGRIHERAPASNNMGREP